MTKDDDSIQYAGNGLLDGVDLGSYTTILQAIFAEGADYTKKSVETRLSLGEKLLGAKSLEAVIQIQSDYAKESYAAFVAQAAKMGELHSGLAKAAFRPAEKAIAAMQSTK
ncbi:MAG: phasin family protein [Methylocella sp.]